MKQINPKPYNYLCNFDSFLYRTHVIINDYGLFPKEDLLDLFNLFPEKYKNSPTGKNYFKIINSRPANIGRSILEANNVLLKSQDGGFININSLIKNKFQFYIIDFTASWCGACRHWAKIYKDKLERIDSTKVNIISISIDTDINQWMEYIKEDKCVWNCYIDSGGFDSKLMKYFNFKAIPEYVLLDRKGVVIAEATGYEVNKIIDMINERLIY